MATLSAFTPAEQELLIRLPYQAGVWMSYQDDDAGDRDDDAEMRTLQFLLQTLLKKNEKSELLGDILGVLADTLRDSDLVMDVDATLQDVAAGLKLVRSRAGMDDAQALARVLVDVASAVARAHGESAGYGDDVAAEGFIGKLMQQVDAVWARLAAGQNPDLNVSPPEDTALQELGDVVRDALRV